VAADAGAKSATISHHRRVPTLWLDNDEMRSAKQRGLNSIGMLGKWVKISSVKAAALGRLVEE
jgi:hypothetical protein